MGSNDTLGSFIVCLKSGQYGNTSNDNLEHPIRSERTINQIIIAVSSFYTYHQRIGRVAGLSIYHTKTIFGSFNKAKPLLHHITKKNSIRSNLFKLKEPKHLIKTIKPDLLKKILDGCTCKRDKFLVFFLLETGCRIGQALGLKHQDIESYNNLIKIVPRDDNENQARAKTRDVNIIHVSKELMELYFEYYMDEYGDFKSEYVFINIWSGAIGKPMKYPTIIALFKKISKKIGFVIMPHMFRHTHATELLKAGWEMAYIQKRLGHKDIQTTMNIYAHITDEDMKKHYQQYIEKRNLQ